MSNPSKTARIGIVVFKAQETGSISLPAAYAAYAAQFGIPVPIYALDNEVHNVDLLILPGGQDIDSIRYSQKPSFWAQNPNVQLEYFDKYMVSKYVEAGIPIFGICRGFQTLNVIFGGSLIQNISQAYSKSTDRGEAVHDVLQTAHWGTFGQFMGVRFDNKKFRVNSLHHQGFKLEQAGKNVVPLLTNPSHNNVEALWVRDLPIVAVQWHPEELQDDFSNEVIKRFLSWKQQA